MSCSFIVIFIFIVIFYCYFLLLFFIVIFMGLFSKYMFRFSAASTLANQNVTYWLARVFPFECAIMAMHANND
jgi:hypothetical protein